MSKTSENNKTTHLGTFKCVSVGFNQKPKVDAGLALKTTGFSPPKGGATCWMTIVSLGILMS